MFIISYFLYNTSSTFVVDGYSIQIPP